MRTMPVVLASLLVVFSPFNAIAQDSKAALDAVSKALGADRVTSIVSSGSVAHPVRGDLPIEVTYGDYKDFGGVKFPTKIRHVAGGHPSLELTVTDVQPNATFDASVPAGVAQAPNPYTRVTSQKVADGVWYLTGGSHHSVVIEMKDHFDHFGGVRGFAARNVTVITHESGRDFVERALSMKATVSPDPMTRSGLRPSVEGIRARRVLSDGTREVEIHHLADNGHAGDMLMVYLPREKLLVEADVYTPLAPNVAPPTPPSVFTVSFADHVGKLGLAVDQILPLHGRIVPFSELNKTIGR